MASGDTLVTFLGYNGIADGAASTTYPKLFTDSTGFYPHSTFPYGGVNRFMGFQAAMPAHYDGGGVTCTMIYAVAAAGNPSTTWSIAFRKLEDGVDNLNNNFTYSTNGLTENASNSYVVNYGDITFTDGADMDNVTAGDFFNLRVNKSALTGGTSDVMLLGIHVKET